MSEEMQITFMQARISRLASKAWGLPLDRLMDLFSQHGVLEYIRDCFDYFHLEGDDAVLHDVVVYLTERGVNVHAVA